MPLDTVILIMKLNIGHESPGGISQGLHILPLRAVHSINIAGETPVRNVHHHLHQITHTPGFALGDAARIFVASSIEKPCIPVTIMRVSHLFLLLVITNTQHYVPTCCPQYSYPKCVNLIVRYFFIGY